MPESLRTKDVAAAWGVTKRTIVSWETQGLIPAAARGPASKSWRRWTDLEAMAKALRLRGFPVPKEWGCVDCGVVTVGLDDRGWKAWVDDGGRRYGKWRKNEEGAVTDREALVAEVLAARTGR